MTHRGESASLDHPFDWLPAKQALKLSHILCHGFDDPAQIRRHEGFSTTGQSIRSKRRYACRALDRHILKEISFMRSIGLHDLDEVRHEIAVAPQLYIYPTPAFADEIALADQSIVDRNYHRAESGETAENDSFASHSAAFLKLLDSVLYSVRILAEKQQPSEYAMVHMCLTGAEGLCALGSQRVLRGLDPRIQALLFS
jgi:hypothetical protein